MKLQSLYKIGCWSGEQIVCWSGEQDISFKYKYMQWKCFSKFRSSGNHFCNLSWAIHFQGRRGTMSEGVQGPSKILTQIASKSNPSNRPAFLKSSFSEKSTKIKKISHFWCYRVKTAALSVKTGGRFKDFFLTFQKSRTLKMQDDSMD